MQNDFKLKIMILALMRDLAIKGNGMLSSNLPVDLFFSNGNIVIKTELAGVERKNISVTMHGNNIIIGYIKTAESNKKRTYYKMERSYGKFEEKIRLPIYIADAKTKASLSDGVLTITINNNKPKEK